MKTLEQFSSILSPPSRERTDAKRQERVPMAFLVSPQAKWMTDSAVRMDGGEIKGV
jgi:hypothetical protein